MILEFKFFQIILIFIGAITSIFYYLKARRDIVWGFSGVVVAYIITYTNLMAQYELFLNIGPFTLYPLDIITYILIVIIFPKRKKLVYLLHGFKFERLLLFWLVYMTMYYMINYLRYPLELSYNASRPWLYSIVFLLYGYILSPRNQKIFIYDIYKILRIVFICMSIYVLMYLPSKLLYAKTFVDIRVLPSGVTLLIAMFSLLSFMLFVEKRRWKYQIYWILSMIIVIILQHRSVWLGYISCIAVYFIISKKTNIIKYSILSIILLIPLTYYIFISDLQYITKYGNFFDKSVITSQEEFENSTFQGRLYRWEAHLLNTSISEYILGKGYGWERSIGASGKTIRAAMHNHYLELLLTSGIAALFLLILIIANLSKRVYRQKEDFTNKLMLPIMYMFLAYGIAYHGLYIFYFFLGTLVASNSKKFKKLSPQN